MSEKLTCDGGRPHIKAPHYYEPQGPTSRHHNAPGLGGRNHGQYHGGETGHETSTGHHGTTHHHGSQHGGRK